MSKIGTAHVEIKPVLNEEALAEVARRIETALADAFEKATGQKQTFHVYEMDGSVTKTEGVLAMWGNELGIYASNPHAKENK